MKFYIYHRPLLSIRKKEVIGSMIHISLEEKEFSPDGEIWRFRRCARPERVYNRLITMLADGGMGEDMIYPLDGKRTIRDLVNHMNAWENK